jgi:hypothetical protein
VRGREREGYRFGCGALLGHGLLLELGQIVSPGALFYFYFFFPLFPFLFSLFIQTLFKFDPNRSKPTLQSFNNSKQPYRTVINKFS